MSPKTWLITGASSGLGLAVAEHVLRQGDTVVAAIRNPSAIPDLQSKYPKTLHVVKVDVANPADINNLFETIKTTVGSLDVVYSNSGLAWPGELEGSSIESGKATFDVNVWGAAQVALESVKYFREVNIPGKGGRLMVAGSIAGLDALPLMGYGSSSKFAIDGFHDSLSKELNPAWNIKVSILNIGAFHTRGAVGVAEGIPDPHPAYNDGPTADFRRYFTSERPTGFAEDAAKVIYEVAKDTNAPLRVAIGLDGVETMKARAQSDKEAAEYAEKWNVHYRPSSVQ